MFVRILSICLFIHLVSTPHTPCGQKFPLRSVFPVCHAGVNSIILQQDIGMKGDYQRGIQRARGGGGVGKSESDSTGVSMLIILCDNRSYKKWEKEFWVIMRNRQVVAGYQEKPGISHSSEIFKGTSLGDWEWSKVWKELPQAYRVHASSHVRRFITYCI